MKEQNKKEKHLGRTGNEKLFIGLIIGVLVGAIFALYGMELLPGGYKYAATVMIGAFFIVSFLLLITVFFRDKIANAIFGEIGDLNSFRSDASALIGSTAEAISDTVTKPFPEEHRERMRWIAPKLANYLIWGRVRSWWFNLLLTIFLAIGGLATTVLLVNQNKLLETQNTLVEGQRRSSLVLLMENVLEDISQEIYTQRQKIKNPDSLLLIEKGGYSLSSPLLGRLSALTQGLFPYKILENGKLSEREYSPEKAYMLLSLVRSNLDSNTITKIYKTTSFARSAMTAALLEDANLKGVALMHSNLDEAFLINANLQNSYLQYASLRGATMYKSNLTNANLAHADLTNTEVNYKQLVVVKSLYEVRGLSTEIIEELTTERPCLFSEEGCY